MSDTQKPAYTRTNVQRFVNLLAADDNISRHAYALLESAGEISYDEVATYRAEAYATSVELENAKKHLELAENALQREQELTALYRGCDDNWRETAEQIAQLKATVKRLTEALEKANDTNILLSKNREEVAALTAENDFLKEKVCELGGIIEGFTLRPKVTWSYSDALKLMGMSSFTGAVSWEDVQPKPKEPKPAIDPGDGYRLLKVGEVIQNGDDARWSYGGGVDAREWSAISPGGLWPGTTYRADHTCVFRRKIEPAAETPKNPFASYVAPKKEQKYRELGPEEFVQMHDVRVCPVTQQCTIVVNTIGETPCIWHGSYRYFRPITEEEAK